jgi:cytoskeletal protein CcmA (bactofilin family)
MAAQATDAITVLGPEASFKGELTLRGAAKILGEFDGSITAAGEVHIGASSVCQATIEADSILVDGTVNGDLIARERLQLTNKARVQGDVSAAALIVAEGASFVGRCAVGPEALSNRTERMTTERATERATTTERATETKPMRLRATGTAPEYAQPQPEWNNAAIPAKPAWMGSQSGGNED